MIHFNLVSIFSHKVIENLPRNLLSLSKIIELGSPKYTHTSEKNNFAIIYLVIVFLHGIKRHILLNLSKITNK